MLLYRSALGGHVVVRRNPSRLWVLLCVLVFVFGAFAGCMSKTKDRSEPATADPTTLTPEQVRSVQYARLHEAEAPVPCSGCIDLQPPTHGEPSNSTPLGPPAPASVIIGMPAVGDELLVTGMRRFAQEPELGGIPFGYDVEGNYQFTLAVDARLAQMHHGNDDGGPRVRMSMQYGAGSFPAASNDFHVDEQTLYVDPETRAVSKWIANGRIESRPAGTVAIYNTQSRNEADISALPQAANLVWLGSHLWGQTLQTGDQLSYTWTPSGRAAPVVWYDYEVTDIRTKVPHVAPDEPALPARTEVAVRLDTHDIEGKIRVWNLLFQDDAPYPTKMRLIMDSHASVDRNFVPPEIRTQTIVLEKRGTEVIVWPAPAQSSLVLPSLLQNGWFHIDERIGSPALDAYAAYPLTRAVNDLRLIDLSHRQWVSDHPDALLVDAALEPQRTAPGSPAATQHVWRLTFANGHGQAAAWLVARMAQPDGVPPVPAHHSESISPAEVPRALREATPDGYDDQRLSAGDEIGPALAALSVDAPFDLVHYRLDLDRSDRLGGFLLMGGQHASSSNIDAGRYGGFVVQDLATGIIHETLRFSEV